MGDLSPEQQNAWASTHFHPDQLAALFTPDQMCRRAEAMFQSLVHEEELQSKQVQPKPAAKPKKKSKTGRAQKEKAAAAAAPIAAPQTAALARLAPALTPVQFAAQCTALKDAMREATRLGSPSLLEAAVAAAPPEVRKGQVGECALKLRTYLLDKQCAAERKARREAAEEAKKRDVESTPPSEVPSTPPPSEVPATSHSPPRQEDDPVDTTTEQPHAGPCDRSSCGAAATAVVDAAVAVGDATAEERLAPALTAELAAEPLPAGPPPSRPCSWPVVTSGNEPLGAGADEGADSAQLVQSVAAALTHSLEAVMDVGVLRAMAPVARVLSPHVPDVNNALVAAVLRVSGVRF